MQSEMFTFHDIRTPMPNIIRYVMYISGIKLGANSLAHAYKYH